MASLKSAPLYVLPTKTRDEAPIMTMLPPLSDEERARLAREREEDEERERRLNEHLDAAARAIAEAQQMLRRPLDSVRVVIDAQSR
jgi:hypothetical protein